jgi:small neutral amino acid transporter SnatA (MarC family)
VLLAAANPATGARVNRAATTQPLAAAVAAAIATAAVLFASFAADPLLDWLDVEQETARIAAGLVLGISGGQAVVLGGPLVRDIPRGWQRGIYPLAIPLAANPALLACCLAFAANPDAGAGRTAVLGLVATLATVAVAVVVPVRFSAASDAGARLTGGLAILVAAAMVVSGVRDV